MVPITKMPQKEMGRKAHRGMGRKLSINPVSSRGTRCSSAAEATPVAPQSIFSPSSMAVTAMIPSRAKRTPRALCTLRSANFLKAVTAPLASIRVTRLPMSPMTSTVKAFSTSPMVSIRASVKLHTRPLR